MQKILWRLPEPQNAVLVGTGICRN